MKKISLCFAGILLLTNYFSQVSFEKKKIVTGLNLDLGIYKTEDWENKMPSQHQTNRAGSRIISAWSEYGILNWLGVGIKLATASYFTSRDSVTGNRPTVNSYEVGLQVSAHILRKKRFNLPITFVFGGSSFSEYNNEPSPGETSLKGNGTFTNVAITPSFFFGKSSKFGMNIKLGWANFTFRSLALTTHNSNNTNFYTLKGSGGNFGFGFQYNIR